jgi:hypothetical protein
MNRRHAYAVLAMMLLGCSATPPPADPTTAPPSTDAPPAASEEPAASASPDAEPAPAPKTPQSIPDDYVISNTDCDALGKRLGEVTRSDELAKVDPKLKPAQRDKAMHSIDEAASKIESQWIASCEKSLVGKVGDPKALKCANDAKSVKAFDTCLNGESPPKK